MVQDGEYWDIEGSASYIVSRNFTVVALQFPDELLKEASKVSRALQDACAAAGAIIKAFVMADTTYNSLGVDEVAAQHASAECVIHYGRASLSTLSKLPAYFVFTRAPLDSCSTAQQIVEWSAGRGRVAAQGMKTLLVLPDLPLVWAVAQLRASLADAAAQGGLELPVVVADVPLRSLEPSTSRPAPSSGTAAATERARKVNYSTANAACGAAQPDQHCHAEESGDTLGIPAEEESEAGSPGAAGLKWDLPAGISASDCLWLWLGQDDAPALTELLLTYSREHWAMYDPQTGCIREGVPQDISRTLCKRAYLIEKAKNANIIGIVLGTLGVAGCVAATEEVRRLARAAGKRTYTFLMGKPSPVKLANFPEVDVFVMMADAQGQILDSKEFYAPIITPHEALQAFGGDSQDPAPYRLDFGALLGTAHLAAASPSAGSKEAAPRFSLVDSAHHSHPNHSPLPAESCTALAERVARSLSTSQGPGALVEVRSAADYLQSRRTYHGLEAPCTGAEEKPVVLAVQGRSGRAAVYADEPLSAS